MNFKTNFEYFKLKVDLEEAKQIKDSILKDLNRIINNRLSEIEKILADSSNLNVAQINALKKNFIKS